MTFGLRQELLIVFQAVVNTIEKIFAVEFNERENG